MGTITLDQVNEIHALDYTARYNPTGSCTDQPQRFLDACSLRSILRDKFAMYVLRDVANVPPTDDQDSLENVLYVRHNTVVTPRIGYSAE